MALGATESFIAIKADLARIREEVDPSNWPKGINCAKRSEYYGKLDVFYDRINVAMLVEEVAQRVIDRLRESVRTAQVRLLGIDETPQEKLSKQASSLLQRAEGLYHNLSSEMPADVEGFEAEEEGKTLFDVFREEYQALKENPDLSEEARGILADVLKALERGEDDYNRKFFPKRHASSELEGQPSDKKQRLS